MGEVSKVLEDILDRQRVEDAGGNLLPLHSGIDRDGGDFLRGLIRANRGIRRTLEVGCAYGISSLYICDGLQGRDAHHVIVDPCQSTQWAGIGILNLDRAGIDFYELIERGSEIALPALAAEGRKFDLVLVDGWHTFDHALLDLFYSNLLLEVGGVIVVDDCRMPAVSKAVSYLSHYPSYRIAGMVRETRRSASYVTKRLGRLVARLYPDLLASITVPRLIYDRLYTRVRYRNMVALEKVAEDDRPWHWFASF